jgi:hypothetical protein
MWVFNQQPSSAARTSLIYITFGAISVIWTGVWYIYLHNNPPDETSVYYWCGGFLVTGLTLMLIGFMVGQIGRSARHADIAPQEVTQPILTPQAPTAAPVAAAPALNANGVLVGGVQARS